VVADRVARHHLTPQLLSQRETELSRSRERSDADTLELECQRAENSAVQVSNSSQPSPWKFTR
jgi:hypothetical protein